MSSVLYLTDVLQLVVDGLDDGPFPKQYLVIEVHQRVLHFPLELCYELDVNDKEHLKEVLADVFPVIGVPQCELPLDDFAFVIDDQVELEPIEPAIVLGV